MVSSRKLVRNTFRTLLEIWNNPFILVGKPPLTPVKNGLFWAKMTVFYFFDRRKMIFRPRCLLEIWSEPHSGAVQKFGIIRLS